MKQSGPEQPITGIQTTQGLQNKTQTPGRDKDMKRICDLLIYTWVFIEQIKQQM